MKLLMSMVLPLMFAAGCGRDLASSSTPQQPLDDSEDQNQERLVQAPAVAAAASQSTTLEGTLEVQIEDDFKNKKSKHRHFLKTESGERYELQFKKNPPQHISGTRVRVHGATSDGTIVLETGGDASYQYLAAPATGVSALGAQNTVVLLVNFQDQPIDKPWTLDQWNSFAFGTASGSMNSFFKENSYQQTWLTGKVFGWYTLPINSTDTCDQNNIANAAKAAAAAAGVDLSPYTRLIFAFPYTSSCTWGGLATIGNTPSQAFSNGSMTVDVVGHELGHSFGLYHSHGLDCDVSAIGNNCTYVEYGDKVDTMGVGYGHFNAAQKERLGWLNYNASPPIAAVQSSGSYTIEPIENGGANPKALKVFKSTDPTTGAKTWYYLEYRQAVGLDSYITTSSIYYPQNILAGVLIHIATDDAGNSNHLLDMTPGSLTAYSTQDLSDSALPVGQTYTDTNAGVTIKPTWSNSAGIGVDITLSKATSCTRANPSVVLSPSQTSSVLAGTAVAYTVAVSNRDSSGCSAATFNLTGTMPSGWSGTWAASSLTIGAGSAASTTFTVTSSTSALAGTYSVSGKATNSGATTYSGSGSASYVVGTSSTTTTVKGKGRHK